MMSDYEGILTDRLSRGEAVPGGPGACDRPGCAHLILWHGEHGRYRDGPAASATAPPTSRSPKERASWPSSTRC